MSGTVLWLEEVFAALPLALLEVWGGFAYFVGLALAICAFGSFTFRLGDRWGFGREWHRWQSRPSGASPRREPRTAGSAARMSRS